MARIQFVLDDVTGLDQAFRSGVVLAFAAA